MPQSIANVESLAAEISVRLTTGIFLIAIDGLEKAGKTPTAVKLGQALKLPVVHLDSFLPGDWNAVTTTYADALDYEMLSSQLRVNGKSRLVEGVCVLDVLRRLGAPADIHVYVRRINKYGIADGRAFDEISFNSRFHSGIQRYRQEYMPENNADFVLELRD